MRLKVAYFFTTFPVLTETPSQRELRVMRTLPVDLEIISLWSGEKEFEGQRVTLFPKWRLLSLLWYLPYWLLRKPQVFVQLARRLLATPIPGWLNFWETWLGVGFAICYAARFAKPERRPDLIHAAWANVPATAAQLIKDFTGIPYTMGAHAYDVFRDGGDWLLPTKLEHASFIITSSESTFRRLQARGAEPSKTTVIRRGLDVFPPLSPCRMPRTPLRILCVARLVEKKGYPEQLAIYARLKQSGFPFQVRIVGTGPLKWWLVRRIAALDLRDNVEFLGARKFADIIEQYHWADVFVFTGKIASDGNRDGLPNVVPEAMAAGVPVVSSPVAGVPEAITDGHNGIIIPDFEPADWVAAFTRLRDDDAFYRQLQTQGRLWVEQHFDARINTRTVYEHFRSIARQANGGTLADSMPIS